MSEIGSAKCREPVRISDKLKALELMGKHHKLLTDKVETETADPTQLAQSLFELLKVAPERARLVSKPVTVPSPQKMMLTGDGKDPMGRRASERGASDEHP